MPKVCRIMIRLVLFDIDGTLIRTGGAGQRAFDRACESAFNIPNGATALNFAGRTDSSIVRDIFGQHDITPSAENFQHFYDSYVFWLDHLIGQHAGCVLPGAVELIQSLGAHTQPPVVGLLTGNIRLGAQIKLTHYPLWDSFRTGAFGDDHEDRNQLAVVALERSSQLLGCRLRGEEVLVVGDTPNDVACGRAIDAKVLAVATGGSSYAELESHRPDWLVASLEQVAVADLCG